MKELAQAKCQPSNFEEIMSDFKNGSVDAMSAPDTKNRSNLGKVLSNTFNSNNQCNLNGISNRLNHLKLEVGSISVPEDSEYNACILDDIHSVRGIIKQENKGFKCNVPKSQSSHSSVNRNSNTSHSELEDEIVSENARSELVDSGISDPEWNSVTSELSCPKRITEQSSGLSDSKDKCHDFDSESATKSHEGSEDFCQPEQSTVISYVSYESELQMPDIMRLIQEVLSEPYSIYTYRYFIHNWPNLCFLAFCGDKCIGAIVCKLEAHYKKAVKRGYIAMLAVDKNYRKRKIGSSLVLKAIRAMVSDGADEVVLETEITNKPALRLYENLGFVRDKRLFRYYLNGVDALRLKLWLT